ncbi:unnamed protein product [Strongylus vulgaris]|uniref:Uncharacterized protein n=1 Tax=Strongylus vulgaris TaxID=40348 RepID=A0A3P7IUE6_STRVU|nr:unnamed protein product [Strongylus vulgaris]
MERKFMLTISTMPLIAKSAISLLISQIQYTLQVILCCSLWLNTKNLSPNKVQFSLTEMMLLNTQQST